MLRQLEIEILAQAGHVDETTTPDCPPCFNSTEEYAAWKALARITAGGRDMNPCIDCRSAYQARMIAVGRCEHPETRFFYIRDARTGELLEEVGSRDGRPPNRQEGTIVVSRWPSRLEKTA